VLANTHFNLHHPTRLQTHALHVLSSRYRRRLWDQIVRQVQGRARPS